MKSPPIPRSRPDNSPKINRAAILRQFQPVRNPHQLRADSPEKIPRPLPAGQPADSDSPRAQIPPPTAARHSRTAHSKPRPRPISPRAVIATAPAIATATASLPHSKTARRPQQEPEPQKQEPPGIRAEQNIIIFPRFTSSRADNFPRFLLFSHVLPGCHRNIAQIQQRKRGGLFTRPIFSKLSIS